MRNVNRRLKLIAFTMVVVAVAAVAALFIADWTLGFLGFSSEAHKKVAHPANHREIRRNLEFQYVFESNSQGLRYRDLSLEKPDNVHRVFVSGDSFTEGHGVETDDRFTELLEGRYRSEGANVDYINGGLMGTGPLEYGRLFLEVGLEYQPDGLLLCVFVNDVANTPLEVSSSPFEGSTHEAGFRKIPHFLWPRIYAQLKTFYWERAYRNRTKAVDIVSAVSRQAEKKGIPEHRINLWKEALPDDLVTAANQGTLNGWILSLGLLYPDYLTDSIDIASTAARRKLENMQIVLTEIVRRSEQAGVEVALVLIPSPFQYDPASHSGNNPRIITGMETRVEWLSMESEIQKQMKQWASVESVPFLDLTPVFRRVIESDNHLNYEIDGHWTPAGHQVAAEGIAHWLSDQQVFSFLE